MHTHTCEKYIYTSEFLCTLGQEILNRRLSCMLLACKSQVSCLVLVLCLHVHVCMHACAHASMYVFWYICINICMYTCIHVCMYTCISRTQANYHLHWDKTQSRPLFLHRSQTPYTTLPSPNLKFRVYHSFQPQTPKPFCVFSNISVHLSFCISHFCEI